MEREREKWKVRTNSHTHIKLKSHAVTYMYTVSLSFSLSQIFSFVFWLRLARFDFCCYFGSISISVSGHDSNHVCLSVGLPSFFRVNISVVFSFFSFQKNYLDFSLVANCANINSSYTDAVMLVLLRVLYADTFYNFYAHKFFYIFILSCERVRMFSRK